MKCPPRKSGLTHIRILGKLHNSIVEQVKDMAEAIIRPPLPERPPLPVVSRELAVPAVSVTLDARLSKYPTGWVRDRLKEEADTVLAYTGNNATAMESFFASVTRFDAETDAVKAGLTLRMISGGKPEQLKQARGIEAMPSLAFIAVERDSKSIGKTLEDEYGDAAARLVGAADVLDKMPLSEVSGKSISKLESDIVKTLESRNEDLRKVERALEEHAEQEPLRENANRNAGLMLLHGLPFEQPYALGADTIALALIPIERHGS